MVKIEPCRDAELLAQIGRTTFVETYAEQTDSEELDEHVAHAYSREQIEAELAEPDSDFFVARADDTLAGYLKINRGQAQTEVRDATGLEIESLYVLRAHQGQGAGRLLLEKALDEARGAGAEYLWLGVWERNSAARRFWMKMGFVEFDSHGFQFGSVEHTDVMMKRELAGRS